MRAKWHAAKGVRSVFLSAGPRTTGLLISSPENTRYKAEIDDDVAATLWTEFNKNEHPSYDDLVPMGLPKTVSLLNGHRDYVFISPGGCSRFVGGGWVSLSPFPAEYLKREKEMLGDK